MAAAAAGVFSLFFFFNWYKPHTIKSTFLKCRYSSVGLNIFTELYNHHNYLIPEHFHHPKKECTHLHSLRIPPAPQALATTSLLSVSMDRPILDIWGKVIYFVAFLTGFLHLAECFQGLSTL